VHARKCQANPVVPIARWTWRDEEVSAPDVLLSDGEVRVYYSARMGSHDRIGMSAAPAEKFDPSQLTDMAVPNPLIDIGPASAPDALFVRHPSIVARGGMLYCFYAGFDQPGAGSICAATSMDGITWRKYVRNPLFSGSAPGAAIWRDHFVMAYAGGRVSRSISLASSPDAMRWDIAPEALPEPSRDDWDSYSITSPRLFEHGGRMFLFYAGDSRHADYPRGIGLAASHDLVHWRRSPCNPLLEHGAPGEWDDGAVWPGGAAVIAGRLYLFYEGCGKGAHGAEKGPPIHSPSQVGCAELDIGVLDF
jgi:predicted GH43/DUF377 family glycosyl hydrolase